MAPKRPPPEYIEKLTKLHSVWAREDSDANKLIFEDLDNMINNQIAAAYNENQYEAFTYLTKLSEYIKTGFAAKLKKELDYVKTLSAE